MDQNGKSIVSGDEKPNTSKRQNVDSSTGPVNSTLKPSTVSIDQGNRKKVSSSNSDSGDSTSTKGKGKAVVSSDQVLFFRDVKHGPNEGEVRFRLIHFWEARNAQTKVLIGIEMLLIDEEGTVMQGFITPGRMETYVPHMVAGGVYRLNKFYGSHSKTMYRVAEPSVTLSFSWKSVLSVLDDSSVQFPEDRFRFHGYEEFEAGCDLKGAMYDYIGHIKLVNGQKPNECLLVAEEELASKRRILLHVQTYGEPVMKLYLWDSAATTFLEKVKAIGSIPTVILVTTVNPKRFGGALTLSSLSSSRVLIDTDVQPTREYMDWLSSNLDVATRVIAEVVTKTETVTIGDLLSYTKQNGAKVAWFECKATVDDVVHGSPWYYIGCGACHTKATKGPTTLMCKKCGKADIVGVPQYLAKLAVYDNTDQASFVLLGDAGFELTGKKASELVLSYYEANENVGDDHLVPVPKALTDTIGQTRRFIVKVSDHNLTGKVQTFTVTKVLPAEAPVPGAVLEGDVIAPSPFTANEDSGAVSAKKSSTLSEQNSAKRPKCG